ncbi:unnamed protein product [Candida verbasci]|uniref:Uncharacterized protein n=1 Tax=Candida verbasci TaxID=1227364 RepID=A0A9W4TX00_9ASCO|nr:unnamed protein product [Candida verbasci]
MSISSYIATIGSISTAALIHLLNEKQKELLEVKHKLNLKLESVINERDLTTTKLNKLIENSNLQIKNGSISNDKEINKLKLEIIELTNQNEKLTKIDQGLNKENDSIKSQLKSFNVQISQLTQELESYKTKYTTLEKQNEFRLNSYIESIIVKKDDEISQLQTKLNESLENIRELKASFENFKSGNNKIIFELREKSSNDLNEKDKQINELEDDYKTMKTDFIQVNKNLKDSKEVIINFEKMKEELKITHQLLNKEISTEKKIKSEMVEKMSFLEETLANYRSEISKLSKKNENYEDIINEIYLILYENLPTPIELRNISSSEDDIDDYEDIGNDDNDKVQILPHKSSIVINYDKVIPRVKDFIDDYEDKISDSRKENNDLAKENDRLKDENSKLKEIIASFESKLSKTIHSKNNFQETITSSEEIDEESGMKVKDVTDLQENGELKDGETDQKDAQENTSQIETKDSEVDPLDDSKEVKVETNQDESVQDNSKDTKSGTQEDVKSSETQDGSKDTESTTLEHSTN